jgi:D-alanyl-D-alanine carboxypeptidase/D-alanyl-D-alanine-endopeptidase (penicillin-binding protein 4)
MRALIVLLCAGATLHAQAPAARPATPLARYVDSLLTAPMWRTAQWGVLVVDPTAGDTLYAANPEKLVLPASNTKLVTGAVALAQLGKDYRYTTRVFGRRPARNGTMPGDLVIVGHGDPSLSDSLSGGAMAPLRAIADTLAAHGVRRIAGRLIRGSDAFPDSTLGMGWGWDDLDYAYSAPVDELMFNEGYARITVRGGARTGDPVTIHRWPATTLPHLGDIDVRTVAQCCGTRSRLIATGDVRGPRPLVHLSGTVRAGDSASVTVALRHPNAAFLDALAEALAERGITVAKGVEADVVGDTAGLPLVTTYTSPPLSAIMAAFQKPSQNQIGELLLKTLGREKTGVGTADSGLAVVRRQLAMWGIDSGSASLRDGSGLSRHNYISPEAVVRILAVMQAHEDFDVFHQALPLGGIDGTVRERLRGTPAMANMRAKTGTLNKARALSGYVTAADGRVLLFSIIANNHTVPHREVERVQDAIVTYLASMDAAPH